MLNKPSHLPLDLYMTIRAKHMIQGAGYCTLIIQITLCYFLLMSQNGLISNKKKSVVKLTSFTYIMQRDKIEVIIFCCYVQLLVLIEIRLYCRFDIDFFN